MRQQVKLTFNMGAERLPDDFRKAIIKLACAMSGGCYVPSGTGFWIDGETHAERFQGKAQAEDTLVIELTCETAKAEGVYVQMKDAISTSAEHFGADIDWVHVTEMPMKGRHFSVAAHNNATTAA